MGIEPFIELDGMLMAIIMLPHSCDIIVNHYISAPLEYHSIVIFDMVDLISAFGVDALVLEGELGLVTSDKLLI
jgi:hypothetical protein